MEASTKLSCLLCKRVFDNSRGFKVHIKGTHNLCFDDYCRVFKTNPLMCERCGAVMKTSFLLAEHTSKCNQKGTQGTPLTQIVPSPPKNDHIFFQFDKPFGGLLQTLRFECTKDLTVVKLEPLTRIIQILNEVEEYIVVPRFDSVGRLMLGLCLKFFMGLEGETYRPKDFYSIMRPMALQSGQPQPLICFYLKEKDVSGMRTQQEFIDSIIMFQGQVVLSKLAVFKEQYWQKLKKQVKDIHEIMMQDGISILLAYQATTHPDELIVDRKTFNANIKFITDPIGKLILISCWVYYEVKMHQIFTQTMDVARSDEEFVSMMVSMCENILAVHIGDHRPSIDLLSELLEPFKIKKQ